MKDNFIEASTFMCSRTCAKHVLTECSNMADLVNRTQNLHHNQAKWSFFIAQRNNLNLVSVYRTFPLFELRF